MAEDETLWIDALIFVLIFIAEVYAFIRLKFQMDFSGKLTLILHFIVSLLRLCFHLINAKTIISLIIQVPQSLVSFSLYYFVFEMKLIRITLIAISHEDHYR